MPMGAVNVSGTLSRLSVSAHISLKSWLSFQKTKVQFLSPTCHLIAHCNYSGRGLIPSSGLQEHQTCTWHRHTCRQTPYVLSKRKGREKWQ